MIRLDRAAGMTRDGDADAGNFYAAETLLALDGTQRQGIITARGREMLAALTPAQRSAQSARELNDLLDDASGMKEIPACSSRC
jgi:hypothetical protein